MSVNESREPGSLHAEVQGAHKERLEEAPSKTQVKEAAEDRAEAPKANVAEK